MLNKIRVLLSVSLFAIAFQAQASHVNSNDIHAFEDPVVSPTLVHTMSLSATGGFSSYGGNLGNNGFDDIALNFTPDVDTTALSALFAFAGTAINGLGIYQKLDTDTEYHVLDSFLGKSGSMIASIIGSADYFLRVIGNGSASNQERGYTVMVSTIPLPAAAWLFLSALGIYGVAGLKKRHMAPAMA